MSSGAVMKSIVAVPHKSLRLQRAEATASTLADRIRLTHFLVIQTRLTGHEDPTYCINSCNSLRVAQIRLAPETASITDKRQLSITFLFGRQLHGVEPRISARKRGL